MRWLQSLRRYIASLAAANLVWEVAHLPLYTIWLNATTSEMALAVLHCTAGDVLIGLSTVTLALFVAGSASWPAEGHRRVVALTVLFGVGYTVFSEWLNVEVRQAWAYRALMPVLPLTGTGGSPLLQWIVLPLLAFRWALRPIRRGNVEPAKHA